MSDKLIKYMNKNLTKNHKDIRVLGIDLGTTNSTISKIDFLMENKYPEEVKCIEIEQHTLEGLYTHIIMPSFIATYNGKLYIGEGAKRIRNSLSDSNTNIEYVKNIFWDCKNFMGVRRTFHKANDGFKTAKEISSYILKYLYDQGKNESELPISRTVVTVPASFGMAQRKDTLDACNIAGIDANDGDLLDEPVAAFLDYLAEYGTKSFEKLDEPKNLLVFDFGGGTCDIAIFKLKLPGPQNSLQVAPLAVSRYHRLGGGDIDLAIVHEVVLPQLCEQNDISLNDLDYSEKKNLLGPTLLSLAESLKIGLCKEICYLQKFNKYTEDKKNNLSKKIPGIHYCELKNKKKLSLYNPTLSATQFTEVLSPFFEKDLLYPQESEYRMTCSIFAPIEDALDRANLKASNIDYCLLVGGSTHIPQVKTEIESYFSRGKILCFRDLDRTQTAVSRGAAYQALTLSLFEHGIVTPVSGDDIFIKTQSGSIPLIKMGTKLPFPSENDWEENNYLTIPRTTIVENIDLRIEFTDSNENCIGIGIWKLTPPLNHGEELILKYRMNTNQDLLLQLWVKSRKDEDPFQLSIENPLTNIVAPDSKIEKIHQMEESIRKGEITKKDMPHAMTQLADLYNEFGYREKALEIYKKLLRIKGKDDIYCLLKMGIVCGELKDYDKEEKFYKKAALNKQISAPFFNLALSKNHQGKKDEAVNFINEALNIHDDPAYYVAKALFINDVKNHDKKNKYLQKAMSLFEGIQNLSDFHLSWIRVAANMLNDNDIKEKIDKEIKSRTQKNNLWNQEGELPSMTSAVQERKS